MAEDQNNLLFKEFKRQIANLPLYIYEQVTDFDNVFNALEKFIPLLENQQMDKNSAAAQVLRENYVKTSRSLAIRRVFTVGEWTSYLNRQGSVPLLDKIRRAIPLLKQVKSGIDVANKIMDIIQHIFSTVRNCSDQVRIMNNFSSDVEARKRFRDDVIALGVLSQILKEIAEFAPPGAEDYIKYNLTVLTDAEKLIKIVDEYADKIEKEAQEAQKEWGRVSSHPGITAGTSLEVGRVLNSNNNVSENKLLDAMEKKK